MMLFYLLLSAILINNVSAQIETNSENEFLWNRWEERTVDCVSSGKKDQCVLLTPDSRNPPDVSGYKCRREPMPQNDWNPLARNSTTRLACPIKCPIDYDLSVLQKRPYVNPNCQKYYTYGKYRDNTEKEWYIWMTEPCIAAITTHCRFHDVEMSGQLHKEAIEEVKHQQVQTKPSEQRLKAARKLA